MSLQVRARLGKALRGTKRIVVRAWQRLRKARKISSATTHIRSLFNPVPKEFSEIIQYGTRGRGRTVSRINAFANDPVNQKTDNLSHILGSNTPRYNTVVTDEEHSPVSEDKELRSVMKLATGNVLRYNTSAQLQFKRGILAALRDWLFYSKKR